MGKGATHKVELIADTVQVHVAGEIDLSSSDELRQWIVAAIPSATVDEIDVDLADVTFLDSTGIRALVLAQRAASDKGVTMRVSGARGRVESVLKITGVYDLLTEPR